MSKHNIFKKALTGIISAAMLVSTVPFTAAPAAVASSSHDYGKALELSLYFYDANMCGTDITDGALTWRKDCHTYDGKISPSNTNLGGLFSQNQGIFDPDGDGAIDLSGGYHDAGDFVKFNLPASYAASTLAWGVYEFEDAYKETGCLGHAHNVLRKFADYLVKSTFLDNSGKAIAFCYQVGDGGSDHGIWRAPEADTENSMRRPAFFVTSSNKGSDQCYEAAAALASISVVLKGTDPTAAAEYKKYAEALYKFGDECGGAIASEGIGGFYSSGTWKDDKAWSECWLYLATDNQTYLNNAKNCSEFDGWIHCWDKVMGGYYCMMYGITGENSWKQKVEENLNRLSSSDVTPQGYYAIGGGWGSARYNTAWQMYAATYQKYSGSNSWLTKYQRQMDYLLGNNNLGMSYLIGYGNKYPLHPHHRGSGQNLSKAEDTSAQKYILWGALVGGPSADDSYNDITNDYVKNEVAIDYNAACVGALAGLYTFVGGTTDGADPIIASASEINSAYDFGGEAVIPDTSDNTITVRVYDQDSNENLGSAELSFRGTDGTSSSWNSSDANPKEFTGLKYDITYTVTLDKLPDGYITAPISNSWEYTFYKNTDTTSVTIEFPLKKAEAATGTAKISVVDAATGELVSGARVTVQGTYASLTDQPVPMPIVGNWNWNTSDENPKTITDMESGDSNRYVDYNISVEAPDGYEVALSGSPDTFNFLDSKNLELKILLQKTSGGEVSYGDANEDNKININDAVLIMSHMANKSKYPISAQGADNADVYQRGDGLSVGDANSIQKYLSKMIKALPES